MPKGLTLTADRGIDMDSDELHISSRHATFIKNMTLGPRDNPAVQNGGEGSNVSIRTPIEGTELLMPAGFKVPEGRNYCIGSKEVPELQQAYIFCFNSLDNHFIYRINADGSLQMVKIDPDFDFQLDPQYFIMPHRVAVFATWVYSAAKAKKVRRIEMVFSNNYGAIRYLNVEDCIATDGFNPQKFPFFRYKKPYNEFLINHGLPYSFACIDIVPVPATAADKTRENRLNNLSARFRIKWLDVWNRESEHGVISTPYMNSTAPCLTSSTGTPRCWKLGLDAGPPTIAKIQVEVSYCQANARNLTQDTGWAIVETIDKYDQSIPTQEWWERKINPKLVYDADKNIITYTFCKDKECVAIDPAETNRVQNPIPRRSATLANIKNALALANNDRGMPPLPERILEGLTVSVEKPTGTTACSPKGVDIKFYAIICSPEEGHELQSIKKHGEWFVFGTDKEDILMEQGQHLPKGQHGIIGYFAGTNEWVISKQYRYDKKQKTFTERPPDTDYWEGSGPHGDQVPVQVWEFKGVTPGKKVFRVASHQASPTDDFRKTSTHLACTISGLDAQVKENQATWGTTEIVVDACSGNVDVNNQIFLLYDFSTNAGGVRKIHNSVRGYLWEDEVSKIPIEKARVEIVGEIGWQSRFTDHNGYFWATCTSRKWSVKLHGTKNGLRNQFLIETRETVDAAGARFRYEELYLYKGTQEYPAKDRTLVKGRILLCDGSSGVAGVPVILSGGGVGVTDANGNYTIVAHDHGDNSERKAKIYVTQGGKCLLAQCQTARCEYCFPDLPVTIPNVGPAERVVTAIELRLRIQNATQRGPQNGGRYKISVQAFDWMGRSNQAESLEKHYVDIPSIQETGIVGFSRIKYQFDPNISYPSDVRRLTLGISKNLNFDDFVTWYVDKVELIDNSGNINKVNPTQIRLYYRGMTEYSIQNNFSTNTAWQIKGENDNIITGDRVEFIANGDGTLFKDRVHALVKYDKDGAYFTIDYTEELKSLSDGAMIKMLRSSSCETVSLFNELCLEIELENGKVPSSKLSGYLNYFDSYMLNRQIPVPKYDDKNEKVPTLTEIKNIAIPFEHHSPSDFWGDHCRTRGRIFVENKYANYQYLSTEIGVSNDLINDGAVHGISYFDNNNFKLFDKNEWGSITMIRSLARGFQVICEHASFVVSFDDDSVRMRNDGTVGAVGANERFGIPQARGEYGCQMKDSNTIAVLNNSIMFLDSSKSAWVYNNGESSVDISMIGCNGWLKEKIKHAQQFNIQYAGMFQRFFHSVFDPRSGDCLLTAFVLPFHRPEGDVMGVLEDSDYVNVAREPRIELNETLALNPLDKTITTFYSFTPEYFATLSGHLWDKQLFSFKEGVPHLHHKKFNRPQNKYLEVYGTKVEPIFEVAVNIEKEKTKFFVSTDVRCPQQLFFCDRITTQTGQYSRLLINSFDKRLNFWSGSFGGDLNTAVDPNSPALKDKSKMIFEGNSLYGEWARIRYVGVPAQNGKYFELDGVNVWVNPVEKSGTN